MDNELFRSYVQPLLGAVSSGLADVLGAKGCGGSGLIPGLSVFMLVRAVCNFKFQRRQFCSWPWRPPQMVSEILTHCATISSVCREQLWGLRSCFRAFQ